MLKTCLAGIKKKNGSVFLGVFISETKKRLHLRKIELNSHSFSRHILILGYVCQK